MRDNVAAEVNVVIIDLIKVLAPQVQQANGNSTITAIYRLHEIINPLLHEFLVFARKIPGHGEFCRICWKILKNT